MHDPIQDHPIAAPGVAIAKDAPTQRGAVERAALAVGAVGGEVGGGGEEQVRGCGGEVREDAGVGGGAGGDDLAGEEIGVDDGEGVGGLAEEVGDCGFAGGDGAGEAEEEHAWLGGGGGRWGFWSGGGDVEVIYG